MRSVLSCLDAAARDAPGRLLYTFRTLSGDVVDEVTFGAFQDRTDRLAAWIAEAALADRGAPLLLAFSPGIDFAVAFFACAKLGILPVPVPAPGTRADLDRIGHVAADCGARAVLCDQRVLSRVESRRAGGAANDALDLRWLDATAPRPPAAIRATPHPNLFLQYTSGSTERPRGVVVTHANVLHNCRLVFEGAPRRLPVGVSWLPHYHDMGLIGFILFAVVTGGTAHLLSPLDFLRRPLLWFRTMAEVGCTITSAPNFALEHCLRDDKLPSRDLAGIDLSALECLLTGAEPVRHATLLRFIEKFASCDLSPHALRAGYGLAEHTLCVTSGPPDPLVVEARALETNRVCLGARPARAGRDAQTIVSCGAPRADVDVRIVDPATRRALPTGQVGEIWVTGPSKAAGYWGRPQLSQQTFEARIEGDSDSPAYLRTGDMGFLHDGALHVCGRAKEMVILRGRNIYPADVEGLLERRLPGLPPGSIAAFGAPAPEPGADRLVVVIEVAGWLFPGLLHAAQREIRRGLKVSAHHLAIVAKGTIPRTSSGKIMRRACAQQWQAGETAIVEHLCHDDADHCSASGDHFAEQLVARLSGFAAPQSTLEQAGIDSLDLVTLGLHLEARLARLTGGRRDDRFAAAVDPAILQSLTVADLSMVLEELDAPTACTERIIGLLGEHATAARHAESAAIEDDLREGLDIAAAPRPRAAGNDVLLTGATGFLGSYLLKSLLDMTERPIHLLVRCDGSPAPNRIAAALAQAGLPSGQVESALRERIHIISGDLARDDLGLERDQRDRLARAVGTIYHCAGEVDYVKPYGVLRGANVGGTRRLLDFAALGADTTVHFVSTTFIFGWSLFDRLRESDRNARGRHLDFGYAQSKWAAEQIVHEAMRRGLKARIYRPSLVTASQHGHFVSRDVTARVLGYMIRHGIFADLENQLSFVPVDVCANNIVAISLLDNVGLDTFHITADDHYTLHDVCALITRDFGYAIAPLDPDAFLAHVNENCHEDDDLFPLRAFINRNLMRVRRMARKRYDNRNYRRARDLSAHCLPHPPLDATVGAIVGFLHRQSLIPDAAGR